MLWYRGSIVIDDADYPDIEYWTAFTRLLYYYMVFIDWRKNRLK